MSLTLIKGTFHATGYSPDGDTIRFKATRFADWGLLSGRAVKVNKAPKRHASIRFEAIDALETHYKGSHQPKSLADAATDYMLRHVGITNVQWGTNHGRVIASSDGTPGFILARTTEMYGRPVAFVFAGSYPRPSGSQVFLTPALLRRSLNYRLVRAGLAYPTYYTGLFHDLRNTITTAAIQAYYADRGVWPYDWTNEGVRIRRQDDIADYYPVMPKLFRRLTAFNKSGVTTSFKAWLSTKSDPIHILSTGHFTNFDTVVHEANGRVRLTVYPEDLVFLS